MSGYTRQFQKNKKIIRAKNLKENNGVYVCEYCNKRNLQTTKELSPDFATIDHFIPLSKGGKSGLYNLRLACKECNDIKANQHPSSFSIPNSLYEHKAFIERSKAG